MSKQVPGVSFDFLVRSVEQVWSLDNASLNLRAPGIVMCGGFVLALRGTQVAPGE